MREPSDYLTEFRDLLTELGCEPVVIGALAAARFRVEPRHTIDVDFLATSLAGVARTVVNDGV